MKDAAPYLMIVLAVCGGSFARADAAPSRDERMLERTSAALDKDAARPDGEKSVETRLKSEFKVDDARIQGLRDQKLGYGEIAIVFALAERMSGGITDANVGALMAERRGPPEMGWGRIAKNRGVALGGVMSKVERVDAGARKQEKAQSGKRERMERGERREKAERAEKSEGAERADRPERPDRTERPENPKH